MKRQQFFLCHLINLLSFTISSAENSKKVDCDENKSDCNLTYTKFCLVNKNNGTDFSCECDHEKYTDIDFDEYCVPTTEEESNASTTRSTRTSRALIGLNETKSAAIAAAEESTKVDTTAKVKTEKEKNTTQKPENMESNVTVINLAKSEVISADKLLPNSTISEQFFCIGLREAISKNNLSSEITVDPSDLLRCSILYAVFVMLFVGLLLSACCVYSVLTKVNAEGLTKQVYSTGRLR